MKNQKHQSDQAAANAAKNNVDEKESTNTTPDQPAENLVEHTVTQKEADHYPLEKQGIHIGDKVVMSEESAINLEKKLENTNSGAQEEANLQPKETLPNTVVDKDKNAFPETTSEALDAYKQTIALKNDDAQPFTPTPEHYENDEENTYGKKLVRTSFNPSKSGIVANVKISHAKAIDSIYYLDANNLREEFTPADFGRWKSLAITNLETAAMYAVKAVSAKA